MLFIEIIDIMKKNKGVIGRPMLGVAEKTDKVGFRLSKIVLGRYPSVKIKQIIMDLYEGNATLVYADSLRAIEKVEVMSPDAVLTNETGVRFIQTEPTKKVNPIVARLASSINGVGLASGRVDKNADRQSNESFKEFASRVFDVSSKSVEYSDSDRRIIDLVLRAYRHRSVSDSGRKSIESYLNKVISDADEFFVG